MNLWFMESLIHPRIYVSSNIHLSFCNHFHELADAIGEVAEGQLSEKRPWKVSLSFYDLVKVLEETSTLKFNIKYSL